MLFKQAAPKTTRPSIKQNKKANNEWTDKHLEGRRLEISIASSRPTRWIPPALVYFHAMETIRDLSFLFSISSLPSLFSLFFCHSVEAARSIRYSVVKSGTCLWLSSPSRKEFTRPTGRKEIHRILGNHLLNWFACISFIPGLYFSCISAVFISIVAVIVNMYGFTILVAFQHGLFAIGLCLSANSYAPHSSETNSCSEHCRPASRPCGSARNAFLRVRSRPSTHVTAEAPRWVDAYIQQRRSWLESCHRMNAADNQVHEIEIVPCEENSRAAALFSTVWEVGSEQWQGENKS